MACLYCPAILKVSMFGLFASSAIVAAGPPEFAPASGLLENFFIGGSVGYLLESGDEMWHLQLGIDLQPKLAGMDQAVFLEVGYSKLEFRDVEQEIIPVTLNYKLERPLFGAIRLYGGAGDGVAFSGKSVDASTPRDPVVPSAPVFA